MRQTIPKPRILPRCADTRALLWSMLLVIGMPGCLVAAATFPLIANAAPVSPPPALMAQLDRMTHKDGVSGLTILVFLRGQLLYRVDGGISPPMRKSPSHRHPNGWWPRW